jgi:hypothetical protein
VRRNAQSCVHLHHLIAELHQPGMYHAHPIIYTSSRGSQVLAWHCSSQLPADGYDCRHLC